MKRERMSTENPFVDLSQISSKDLMIIRKIAKRTREIFEHKLRAKEGMSNKGGLWAVHDFRRGKMANACFMNVTLSEEFDDFRERLSKSYAVPLQQAVTYHIVNIIKRADARRELARNNKRKKNKRNK